MTGRNKRRSPENSRTRRQHRRVVRKPKGEPVRSLADALKRMSKSPFLARIQLALKVHRTEHPGYFPECQSPCCTESDDFLRWMVEQAEEEVAVARRLDKAKERARTACPNASAAGIEFLAEAAVKAASPLGNYSTNPLNWLESPYNPARIYDRVRIYNRKYPGLGFNRGPNRTADPAVSAAYYKRFHETDSNDVLLEFMQAYPVEFRCSGWAMSAAGEVLLGMRERDASSGEERAGDLFRRYWKYVKHPKPLVPTLPQQFVMKVAEKERETFSGKHRDCFLRVFKWLASDSSRRTVGACEAFKARHASSCGCIASIQFGELGDIAEEITLLNDKRYPDVVATDVLERYVGAICGAPVRTIRSWNKRKRATVANIPL